MNKVWASILGLAVAVTVPAVAIQQFSGSGEMVPNLIDANSVATEYKGRFGYDFSYFFASTKDEKNKEWWETVSKARWEKDKEITNYKFSTEFANIDSAYEGKNSLREKCNAAYKKSTRYHIHKPITQDEAKDRYERDIWRYCSKRGELPITLEKSNDEWDQKIKSVEGTGVGKGGRRYLISTRDPRNRWFWEIQEATVHQKIENGKKDKHVTALRKLSSIKGNTLTEKCETLYQSPGVGNYAEDVRHAGLFCSLIADN